MLPLPAPAGCPGNAFPAGGAAHFARSALTLTASATSGGKPVTQGTALFFNLYSFCEDSEVQSRHFCRSEPNYANVFPGHNTRLVRMLNNLTPAAILRYRAARYGDIENPGPGSLR
jgi:hypothetical protein